MQFFKNSSISVYDENECAFHENNNLRWFIIIKKVSLKSKWEPAKSNFLTFLQKT